MEEANRKPLKMPTNATRLSQISCAMFINGTNIFGICEDPLDE
jgi:hypothetical protein